MTFKIDSVDHEPDDLAAQLPLRGRLLRAVTGPDPREYWLAQLERPISWTQDGVTRTIHYLILKPRWAGTSIESGAKIPVGISYVIDDALLSSETFTSAQVAYVAIGMVKVPGRGSRVTVVAITWVTFMAGLLAGGELEDFGSVMVAGATGAVLVIVGFAAAARCRMLATGARARPARFVIQSIAAGAALGLVNLAANWTIAQSHPALRTLLTERMAALPPLEAGIASPIVEEIAVRLFLMSVLAWAVFRVTGRHRLAFVVALIGSAVVFALLHLARPFPGDPAIANAYRVSLLIKYTLAGVPLGWIFWRWGLPYSILCHIAANAAHLAVQGYVF